MKKIYLFIFLGLLLISFVHAEKEICIDFDAPVWGEINLEVTASGTDIILTWDAATDVPDCSGIESYNVYIYKDENLIATTSSDTLTFTHEDVPYGTYSYSVYAIDKVSHNSGDAIKNDVVLSEPPTDEGDSSDGGSTKVSGGSGGSSYVCYEEWECDEWSACANDIQTRTCTDIKKCGTTKNKPLISKDCGVEEDNSEGTLVLSSDEDKSFLAGITGAVTETLGTGGTVVVSVLILGIVGAFAFIKIKKRRIS